MKFRSIDGSGNNLLHPDLNAAGTDFDRLGPAEFANGFSTPVDGPNPRMISNIVVGQGDADVANGQGLSGMMYAWGQFIDHDLDLSPSDGTTHIDITIPEDDQVFVPGTVIPLTRAVIDPNSGKDLEHPAIAVNSITGWLDASMVYGSDAATAASLRLADGHMKTSAGDNLPIVNGAFAAGDVRVAENPSLTALQTLFVREHNFQVDRLHEERPWLSGNQLYDQARAIVGAEIAHITYSEFLPHLLGQDALSPYEGYDPSVDPRISVEFAGAAFRFGHSIVSGETEKLGELGQLLGETQELKDVFFEPPSAFAADSGADGVLRHLGADLSQAMDVRIINDLRNFLFDPPAGQDLAAINIERGRDLGLGTLNQTRETLGLQPYTDFAQITHDQGTVDALRQAYGDVDRIDLWAGGLAEDLAPGAFVGQTFQKIIATQFEALRDGDRLWFENAGFDRRTLGMIENTTLSDLIDRDTSTKHMQADAFVFYDRHSGTLGGIASEHPDSSQLVIGSPGNDTLLGGPQGDVLVAAAGRPIMTGAAGDDEFVFTAAATRARITDFHPGHDTLDFDLGQHLSFRDVDLSSRHGTTIASVGGVSVELPGIDPHQLHSGDFIFEA